MANDLFIMDYNCKERIKGSIVGDYGCYNINMLLTTGTPGAL